MLFRSFPSHDKPRNKILPYFRHNCLIFALFLPYFCLNSNLSFPSVKSHSSCSFTILLPRVSIITLLQYNMCLPYNTALLTDSIINICLLLAQCPVSTPSSSYMWPSTPTSTSSFSFIFIFLLCRLLLPSSSSSP